MSILSQLGIDSNVFAAMINEPDILENNNKTTMLRLGREVAYKGSINGKAIDAFVTLREASLTRLSLLEQEQKSVFDSNGNRRKYYLVTGVMQPVQIDIDLMIDGNRINMVDLFHQIACEAAGKSITKDEFLLNARKIGLNYIDGQPLFFQQFGASLENFKELIEVFKDHGAQSVWEKIDPKKRGRIQAAYELKPGIELSAFEVGTVDRTRSARFKHDNVGQGFLNLVDAQFDQLTRILGLRKSAKVKRAEAELLNDEEKAILMRKSADIDLQMSRMAVSNWAGAQKRIEQLDGGSFKEHNTYDPVNLPCGRFTLVTNTGEFEADLWTNNANKITAADVPTLKSDETAEPF